MNSIIYRSREIEDEQLALIDKEGNYYLGPGLTLRRCELILGVSSRWLHILPTRLVDCTIVARPELKSLAWTRASLKGCQFRGRITNCDFGPWRDYTTGWEYGSVEDCDFTKARLGSCRFHGCDMRTVRLPPWPCFTILNPIERSRELNSVEWPDRFGRVMMKNIHTHPVSTVAITLDAPSEAKRYGTTPEVFKSIIEKFDFIVY